MGAGALSVTTTGSVTGTTDTGIYAENSFLGSDLIIDATEVLGDQYGIQASNVGTGAASIATTGLVMGTAMEGIHAQSGSRTTDLTIQAVDVFGGNFGINAGHYGSGALSVTSTGTVTGNVINGIDASNANGSDLTIQANNVLGSNDGIYAVNFGTGLSSITTTGSITGTNEYGIYAVTSRTGQVSLKVADSSLVQGGIAGINLNSAGPVDIINFGTIRNLSGISSDTAITTIPNELVGYANKNIIHIDNSGLVLGTVQLSDDGNSFINNTTGSWDTSGGTNNFGSLITSNSLVNNGTLIVANGTAADPIQTTTFNNIGTLSNSGIITMANGRVGDIT